MNTRHMKLCIGAALSVLITGCASNPPRIHTDTLTQVLTLDGLMKGLYDGVIPLSVLREHGDFGLGTFDKLDGEMVLLDGAFYRVSADGVVRPAPLDATAPFAAVTFFENDHMLRIPADTGVEGVGKLIDRELPTANVFYAVRIDGRFKAVKTRSVPAQTKPYKPLVEIAKTQPVFTFADVEGTMVGFRCPSYIKGLNFPGYHLHFLTKDRTGGGHVLSFTVDHATARLDKTSRFEMILPQKQAFYDADLAPAPQPASASAVSAEYKK